MMNIRFSVIVPVYNAELYIRDCITSVLNQSYTNYELLLVDDGSMDKSGDICDGYCKSDSRIKVFHKKNAGQIHSRSYAMNKASGNYYVFLDADDMLKKNALEIIFYTIQKYKCDCVIFGFERIREGIVISQTFDSEDVCLNSKAEIYRKCLFEADKNAVWRKAVKASVFQNIDYSQYYHLRLGEDLIQSLEVYKNSRSIAFIKDILYMYRMNPMSVTHNSDYITVDFTVREKVLNFILAENVFTKYDIDRYRDFCISLLISLIISIGKLDINTSDKIKMLKEIRRENYYKSFLRNGITDYSRIGSKAVLYYLFKHGFDSLLVKVIWVGHNLQKMSSRILVNKQAAHFLCYISRFRKGR